MADWTDPNGMQLKALHRALLSAYPSPDLLDMMFTLELDRNYAEFAAQGVGYGANVFRLLIEAKRGGWLPDLVAAARADVPGNPKLRALDRTYGLTSAPMPAQRRLEDLVRDEGGFQDLLPWVERLERMAYRVCQIEYPVPSGKTLLGTGWLVAKDMVLTNWHVVARVLAGDCPPEQVTCWFDHHAINTVARARKVAHRLAADWCVSASAASEEEQGTGPAPPAADQLDYALLRLTEPVGETRTQDGQKRGWIELRRGGGPPAEGAILFVLQHPLGLPLKLSPGVSRGPHAGGLRLLHDADTEKGSSGSPCLNAELAPVALHNAGDPLYDGIVGEPEQNQAVPLAVILDHLASNNVAKFWAN